MNTFGGIFRISIFGESHGPVVGVAIDGVPPGIPILIEDFLADLKRRQGGLQKGSTPRKEEDRPIFQSGIFKGHTTGAALTIIFENNNIRPDDYERQRSIPRPGHVDFVAHQKYKGFEDYRGGGHFSARLTTGVVAAGVIAKKIIRSKLNSDITIEARVIEVGGLADIEQGLLRAIAAKDSVGGIIECVAKNLPVGLGEPFWDSLESLLAHAMFAIPAVKGIEFGAGFAAAKMTGSEHNDAIMDDSGKTRTNHAGGIVGGLSNGNDLVFRIVVKATSSTPHQQRSWNWDTKQEENFSVKGRHDLCVALRAPVIVEAMTAVVLADLALMP
jgi:chorismate synthase